MRGRGVIRRPANNGARNKRGPIKVLQVNLRQRSRIEVLPPDPVEEHFETVIDVPADLIGYWDGRVRLTPDDLPEEMRGMKIVNPVKVRYLCLSC